MNRRFLTIVFISACCFLVVSKTDACEQLESPVAVLNPELQSACPGDELSFDGSTSYDRDEEGSSITAYYWYYSDDPATGWFEDVAQPSTTFNDPGIFYVYLYVIDDETEKSWPQYDVCEVRVFKVNDVIPDKTSECVGQNITFTANAWPSDPPSSPPLNCIEWQYCYRQNTTDPWGDWGKPEYGGDNTALLNSTTPGYYKYRARNGPGDSWKESVAVTMVQAKIDTSPAHVLVYTGSYAGDQPTKNAIALGYPAGGTFEWSYEQHGDGDIEFGGVTNGPPGAPMSSQSVEIKGTQPSNVWLDVELKVTYTLDGAECEAPSTNLTVRRPKTTVAISGECHSGVPKHNCKYYHPVGCQFGYLLDDLGIPFDEVVTLIEGEDDSETGSGSTQYCEADNQNGGQWLGGVAVPDTLACPAGTPYTIFHQKLYGGGWLTTPEFHIFFNPMEAPAQWPSIWKETAPE